MECSGWRKWETELEQELEASGVEWPRFWPPHGDAGASAGTELYPGPGVDLTLGVISEVG